MQALHSSISKDALVAAQHLPTYGTQETPTVRAQGSDRISTEDKQMAYMTQTLAASPAVARVVAFYEDLMVRRAKYRLYRETLGELSMLTSRELADLGISPSNIRSIAYEAAYK